MADDKLNDWFNQYLPEATVQADERVDESRAELMTLVMKHWRQEAKVAIKSHIAKEVVKELEKVLTMNGWHEGDWKQAITERISELKSIGGNE